MPSNPHAMRPPGLNDKVYHFRKGTHSFRRNAITDVVNASGGNIILASKLFGNSPEVAKKNYFTGIDMQDALECLNKRKFS